MLLKKKERTRMNEIVEALASGRNVLITCHSGVDGDALGSMLALKRVLEKRGAKRVTLLNDRVIPFYLQFLPGADEVMLPDDISPEERKTFDLGILLDCAQYERAGRSGAMAAETQNVVVIDHHTDPGPEGAFSHIDPSADSVCSMIHEISGAMGVPLDKELAECLYVGLLTDTGSFRHSNTTQRSFELAAELVAAGVDPHQMTMAVYETMKHSTLKLLGIALEKLRISEDGCLAWTSLSGKDFEKAGADDSETEGIVNYGRTIKGVEVSLFLRERSDGTIHATMRSKGAVDVAAVAREFGGGGHKMAAGCSMVPPLDQAVLRLRRSIEKYFAEHKGSCSHG